MTLLNQGDLGKKAADTIRLLAVDGVQKANSGHPGMPMGMADCAFVLWHRFLKFNPRQSDWINRDRFILSAGHGSMLLYALLYLSGFDVTLEDLQNFRQWGSRTPGHPELNCLPGVETSTGPLGQGFANGIGMAVAARMLAARFNTPDFQVFGTHRIFGIVSDGDLMEGISHESASLAGHLKLGNVIYIYDDNHITIEGSTELAFSESVKGRFESYGWQVQAIDGHDHRKIENALQNAISEESKPSIIIARTHIAYGSPNKHDTAEAHGAPLGVEEVRAAKKQLGFPEDKDFFIPKEVTELFKQRQQQLIHTFQEWERQFVEWKRHYPDLAKELTAFINREIPADLSQVLLQLAPSEPAATRSISGKMMQKIAELVPGFCGGSADLAPSNKTWLKNYPAIYATDFSGCNFHFGIREHAMGGICNGITLYGGFLPYAATFLVFSDYMRPSIRLAALMELPVTYIFTHDSIFVGEDGPTHQPVEQICSLRCIPNLIVFRPADGLELAMAWSYAIENKHGPVALILTRQNVPPLIRSTEFRSELVLKGAYPIKEPSDRPDLIIVATGSEVALALNSAAIIETQGQQIRVVSMPSRELFLQQNAEYRKALIPDSGARVVFIEAGVSLGWLELTRCPSLCIGIDRFGASAPAKVLADKFGLTTEGVVQKIINWIKQ